MDCHYDNQCTTSFISDFLSAGIKNLSEIEKQIATCERDNQLREIAVVYMPEVQYFSHDDGNYPLDPNLHECIDEQLDAPWALLSCFDNGIKYAESKRLQHKLDISDCLGLGFDWDDILKSELNGTV